MYDKSDSGARLKRTPATLRLRSGETERATALVPNHRTLRDELNDPSPFLEVELPSGTRAFMLKIGIDRLDPDPTEARGGRGPAGERGFGGDGRSRFEAEDPRVVLGIPPEAGPEEARRNYLDLARAYHPDRLASLGLPDELVAHAGRVLARVNAAYGRLSP